MERLVRNAVVLILVAGGLLAAPAVFGQTRPYIGFVYPAGGQQGTKFQVRLGGQGMDDVNTAVITGKGVTAKLVEYRRRLGPQETQLLNEQMREIRKAFPAPKPVPAGKAGAPAPKVPPAPVMDDATKSLMEGIQTRVSETTQRPANASISNIAIFEITIAPDAEPGRRELTLASPGGVSNPLVFLVGQFPEVNRKPMLTAEFQVLGKEVLALRKRPDDEIEQQITLPATLNGQIASGEVNRYRFQSKKGQKLVISVAARQLNPFVADAVPGWFQPVLALYDAKGKELAFNDDFRFRPDPVILHEVAQDGELVLDITDAIYRGREDFVYRISIGEIPFVTSIFPLGGKLGAASTVQMKGWNLQGAKLIQPPANSAPGTYAVPAIKSGTLSIPVPYELSTLPEVFEHEPNNVAAGAQKVTLPITVNGRIDRPDDWDVFYFTGKAGQTVVAEVKARRLESPLDSVLKVTDASGKVIAYNDDNVDPEAGTNTQDADSYVSFTLPADGTYYVHLGDTARLGGDEYAYRLRISPPQPDFSLRIVPSSMMVRSKSTASVNVQVIRKDGFNLPIKLALKNPPAGFTAAPAVIAANQQAGRINIKTEMQKSEGPITLCIEGTATFADMTISHCAVPVEDRMQAFLWRHMVPANEFKMVVFDPTFKAPPKRVPKFDYAAATQPTTKPATTTTADNKAKFSKQQVASRLRQLKTLYDDGLLTDEFYLEKLKECAAAQ